MAVDEPPAATHEPTTVAARLVDEPPIDPPAAVGGRRRGPRAMALAAGLLIAVGATATAMALGGEDEPREGVDAGAPAGPDATSTGPTTAGTTRVAVPADEAFTLAADRLVSAGSFAYAGTTSAIDVSPARPGLWLAVELTVEGEVSSAAGQLHEIAADGDGQAVETVTNGPSVWSRRAATRATLDDAPYIAITGDSGEEPAAKGVALLPTWLRSTVDGAEAGTDALGRRLVRGVLPAEVLGEVVDGRPASAADVVLTLDDTGDPVSVEITSVPSGPALRLTLDLVRIGEPVTIDLP